MRLGTKSLLFGVHQVFIHPFFVAWAWQILYGFPKSFPLWVAFFVHDFGYFGKPNMDGPEGKTHPELGGRIMTRLFGQEWGDFTLFHSRFYAKQRNRNFSQFCVADKLASLLYPTWLYVFLARLSGELTEYRSGSGDHSAYWQELTAQAKSDADWHNLLKIFLQPWVEEHTKLGDPPPDCKIRDYRHKDAKSNQLESR